MFVDYLSIIVIILTIFLNTNLRKKNDFSSLKVSKKILEIFSGENNGVMHPGI